MNRILVIGSTGNVGRQVVDQLAATGVRFRAMTRNPDTAGLPLGVEVVRGDLMVPETLDRCLQDEGQWPTGQLVVMVQLSIRAVGCSNDHPNFEWRQSARMLRSRISHPAVQGTFNNSGRLAAERS